VPQSRQEKGDIMAVLFDVAGMSQDPLSPLYMGPPGLGAAAQTGGPSSFWSDLTGGINSVNVAALNTYATVRAIEAANAQPAAGAYPSFPVAYAAPGAYSAGGYYSYPTAAQVGAAGAPGVIAPDAAAQQARSMWGTLAIAGGVLLGGFILWRAL